MASKGSWLDVAGICLLFILLSVVGIIWDVASGLLTSGIDGIMLIGVCLMTAGIFTLMLLMVLHTAGLLPKFGKAKVETTSAPAKPAAPASVAPTSPAAAASAPAPKHAVPPPTVQGK